MLHGTLSQLLDGKTLADAFDDFTLDEWAHATYFDLATSSVSISTPNISFKYIERLELSSQPVNIIMPNFNMYQLVRKIALSVSSMTIALPAITFSTVQDTIVLTSASMNIVANNISGRTVPVDGWTTNIYWCDACIAKSNVVAKYSMSGIISEKLILFKKSRLPFATSYVEVPEVNPDERDY